jgi:hypothetical protein
VYIGQPMSLRVEPGEVASDIEHVWISDHFANRIVGFGPGGSFEGQVGAPGPGPHELQGVTLIFPDGPGEIAAADVRTREIKWFRMDDGSLVRASRYRTGSIGAHSRPIRLPSNDGERLLFPLLDPSALTPLAIFHRSGGGWRNVGDLPVPHRNSLTQGHGAFAAFYSSVMIDELPDGSIMVALTGVADLFRFDPASESTSRLGTIPTRFRKGNPPNLWRSFDIPGEYGKGLPFDWASSTFGAWVLSDGRIAVVHIDQTPQGEPPALQLTATSYLTILDPEGDTACVDLPMPGGDEIRPVFDMRNDVLYVLDRRLGADLDAVTWLLKVPVPPMDACPEAHRDSGWLDPNSDVVLP